MSNPYFPHTPEHQLWNGIVQHKRLHSAYARDAEKNPTQPRWRELSERAATSAHLYTEALRKLDPDFNVQEIAP